MSEEHPLANYPAPPPRGEDLPWDDGEPMETERHRLQMELLIESLQLAWKDRQDFYAGGNMFVYFSETQARHNDFRGPDVFVVLQTTRKERKSWVVWEEEGRTPDVVIEILSPKTEKVDRGEKMRIYARAMRVPCYVLYDPFTHVLEAYALDRDRDEYTPLLPDERGFVPCPPLRLHLEMLEGSYRNVRIRWLRWIDADGCPLPSGEEFADKEKRRADELAERLAVLERRVEDLGGGSR